MHIGSSRIVFDLHTPCMNSCLIQLTYEVICFADVHFANSNYPLSRHLQTKQTTRDLSVKQCYINPTSRLLCFCGLRSTFFCLHCCCCCCYEGSGVTLMPVTPASRRSVSVWRLVSCLHSRMAGCDGISISVLEQSPSCSWSQAKDGMGVCALSSHSQNSLSEKSHPLLGWNHGIKCRWMMELHLRRQSHHYSTPDLYSPFCKDMLAFIAVTN